MLFGKESIYLWTTTCKIPCTTLRRRTVTRRFQHLTNEKTNASPAAVAPASEHDRTAEIPAARPSRRRSERLPVSFATTALLRDSTAVAAVAADAQGRFELSAEAAGDYRLQITMVGYNPETQPVTLRTAATDAGTIRLRQGVDIDQVTVTIQKPLVTADAEKTTYSVEDDPQAASSTLRRDPAQSAAADHRRRGQREAQRTEAISRCWSTDGRRRCSRISRT